MKQILLEQGLDLLIYGMGTVFVFLAVLVVCCVLMAAVIGRFFPEAPEPVGPPPPADGARVSARTLAVIQAAIHEHRAKSRSGGRQ